jgi:hypothetical protein|tara:strand:+ start:215 stop:556 length:342 start_codon:yes stop_codon:yes gene_type:complete
MDTLPSVLFPALLLYIGAAVAEQPEPEFGSAGNPVKTQGKEGTREYIDNLDCENGAIPEYKHESSAEVGPSGKKLDKYIMRCEADSVQIFAIYLDPNHAKTDTRPVKGFTSWL